MAAKTNGALAVSELIQFLNHETAPKVRHTALAYVVGVSATTEGLSVFQADTFALTKALCKLFESAPQDQPAIYSALINSTSDGVLIANEVVGNVAVISLSILHCKNSDSLADAAAKLLSNLSLHFSAKVNLLCSNNSGDYVDYLGYILINCTELPSIRHYICDHGVKSLFPLITQSEKPKRRLIAVDIIRNLCFDDLDMKI
uniref:DUF383 domain-containing protein n=1 Tax=Syphacia muris TaxID=451379 RepID=A0A158R5S0_9BILA